MKKGWKWDCRRNLGEGSYGIGVEDIVVGWCIGYECDLKNKVLFCKLKDKIKGKG